MKKSIDMLTKKQVFEAALKYAQEQNPTANKAGIAPNDDFIAGAKWATEQMQAENAELRGALRAIINAADADHSPVYAETLFAEISKAKTVLYK